MTTPPPNPPRPHLTRLGEELKAARLRKRLSQKEVADLFQKEISQSQLAQLEAGGVSNPDPETLRKLSFAYGISYETLVACLVQEKFGISESRTRFLQMDVRDVEELAAWEESIAPTDLWIIAPNFVDEENVRIQDAVVFNIRRGCILRYFVDKADLEDGKKFGHVRQILKARPDLRNLTQPGEVRFVPLAAEQLSFLTATSFVIANPLTITGLDPHGKPTEGYVVLSQNRVPTYGIPMTATDLKNIIYYLDEYYQKVEKDVQIITFTKGL